MREGFSLTPDIAMVFFKYCIRYKIPNNEQCKVNILRRLVAKKKAKYLRNPQEFIQGKKVLHIKKDKNNEK